MKFRNIFIFGFLILLVSCEQKGLNNTSKLNLKLEKKYKNIGFSLIYNNNLNLKKLDNDSLQIFHKNLNNKSLVKISNPLNGKTLIAEVKSNRVKFSNFYNSIITNKIAEMLELNSNEPYIEITLVSKHSTFVAKKSLSQICDKALWAPCLIYIYIYINCICSRLCHTFHTH